MIADLTPDRSELVLLVRRFLNDRAPVSETRLLPEGSHDAEVWKQLGHELGLQGIAIPEEYGGASFGVVELGLVMEELGAQLYNGPFLSSICLAAPTLLAAGTPDQRDTFLPAIATGDQTAALAHVEPEDRWDATTATTTWHASDEHVLVNGTKAYVVDGSSADWIIVTAAELGGPSNELSFILVERTAPGLRRHQLPTLDQTRALSRIDLSDTPGILLGTPGGAGPLLQSSLQTGYVLLAAEQLGGAQHCLDMTVEYAGSREQFGRAIGSFQAIKHRCADTLLDVETARSAVLYALAALESGSDAAAAASLARAHCSEVFERAASTYVHVLGGIGFTWEHEAHLYLKRAQGSQALFGSPSEHRELLAQELGLG